MATPPPMNPAFSVFNALKSRYPQVADGMIDAAMTEGKGDFYVAQAILERRLSAGQPARPPTYSQAIAAPAYPFPQQQQQQRPPPVPVPAPPPAAYAATPPPNRPAPRPTSTTPRLSTESLIQRFSELGADVVRDIIGSCNNNLEMAEKQLSSLSGISSSSASQPTGAGGGGGNSQELIASLKALFPGTDEELIREALASSSNDVAKAVEILQSWGSVQGPSGGAGAGAGAGGGSADAQVRRTAEHLCSQLPGFDLEFVVDVIIACKNDLDQAVATLLKLQQEEEAKKQAESDTQVQKARLSASFPQYDKDTIADVLSQCGGSVDKATQLLSNLAVDIRPLHTPSLPNPVDVASVALDVGHKYTDFGPGDTRRIIVLLDDSGSMAGANVRQAHALIQRILMHINTIPSKVILFGSKSQTRIISDWDRTTDWRAVFDGWQGRSGRTYLWQCLLDFVRIEDPRNLHLMLITDGADTESLPPYTGIDGMLPTVDELNRLGFMGEIHLVALGQEISIQLGKTYMALAGATGGTGAVMNTFQPEAEDLFVSRFVASEAVSGAAGRESREKRVREYAAQVEKGQAEMVPSKALYGLMPELQRAFERQPLPQQTLDALDRRAFRMDAPHVELSPELAAVLARRRERLG